MKRTLNHQQPNGEIATRQTERDYTYVTLIDGVVKSWHDTEKTAERKVNGWINQGMRYPTPGETNKQFRARFDYELINSGKR